MFARQIGGRTLGGESTCWKVLFPADHLRIDGRVPVDKSAQYMTAMRLNPTKELIAVAFSPDSETSAAAFDALAKHLLAKGCVFFFLDLLAILTPPPQTARAHLPMGEQAERTSPRTRTLHRSSAAI